MRRPASRECAREGGGPRDGSANTDGRWFRNAKVPSCAPEVDVVACVFPRLASTGSTIAGMLIRLLIGAVRDSVEAAMSNRGVRLLHRAGV